MSRRATTTLGFLLIFIGIQLNLIDSYTLTPRATQFWAERLAGPEEIAAAGYNGAQNLAARAGYAQPGTSQQAYNPSAYNPQFSQAGYTSPYGAPTSQAGYNQPPRYAGGPIMLRPKTIRPPEWVCWPVLFLGAVLCLVSFVKKRD